MKTTIIACRTIYDELQLAISETGVTHPVVWIESGLHNIPDNLKKRLQEELDKITGAETVLLAFGYCGNALLGLKVNKSSLIVPRADDCITMMLGSVQKRKEISNEMGTYFLTKGWLAGERNIWAEYQDAVSKFGKEKADRIFAKMLHHYERLGIIETGAYKLEDILNDTEKIASELKLKHQIIPGTLNLLKKLLTGPWDEDFLVIKPGETITMKHLYDGPAELDNKQLI